MDIRNIRFILYAIIVSIFILVLSLLSLFVVVLLLKHSKKGFVEEEETYDYQILQLNPYTNESFVGFSEISEFLEPYHFISYENEETGFLTLISNHEETEYLCSGVCYCESVEYTSRRSTQVVRKTVYYLVSAVSSIFALQAGKEYFENECKKKMSDYCSPSNVVSEIDRCEAQDLMKKFDQLLDDDGVEVTKDTFPGKYLCRGFCIGTRESKFGLTGEQEAILDEICGNFGKGAYWDFDPLQMNIPEGVLEEIIEVSNMYKLSPSRAMERNYASVYLHPFCTRQNVYDVPEGTPEFDVLKRFSDEDTVCVGYFVHDDMQSISPRTRCKKIL